MRIDFLLSRGHRAASGNYFQPQHSVKKAWKPIKISEQSRTSSPVIYKTFDELMPSKNEYKADYQKIFNNNLSALPVNDLKEVNRFLLSRFSTQQPASDVVPKIPFQIRNPKNNCYINSLVQVLFSSQNLIEYTYENAPAVMKDLLLQVPQKKYIDKDFGGHFFDQKDAQQDPAELLAKILPQLCAFKRKTENYFTTRFLNEEEIQLMSALGYELVGEFESQTQGEWGCVPAWMRFKKCEEETEVDSVITIRPDIKSVKSINFFSTQKPKSLSELINEVSNQAAEPRPFEELAGLQAYGIRSEREVDCITSFHGKSDSIIPLKIERDRDGKVDRSKVGMPKDGLVKLGGKTYKIFGAIVHHGKDSNHGHYTAYVSRDDGSFYHCNDGTITKLKNHEYINGLEDSSLIFLQKVDDGSTNSGELQTSHNKNQGSKSQRTTPVVSREHSRTNRVFP